jgi:hypothetical protein
VSKALVAGLPVLAVLVQLLRRPRNRQDQLKADLELLGLLPDESTARDKLLQHIDCSVQRLVSDEEDLRRDPMGIGLGVVFLLAAVVLIVFAVRGGGWWLWIGAFVVGALGAVGLGQDAVPRRRDLKGRPLPSSNSAPDA